MLFHTGAHRSRPPLAPPRPAALRGPCRTTLLWWLALLVLWILASGGDRLWLAQDQRLPGWDQADYLNSAVDHGRALGLLPGGGWSGWADLLDLSPKIPPLASLVNGSVMALSGDSADQASWSLALWHGLLLLTVAGWGRQLLGRGFGLLAAALVALAPALCELRVDFTLDLPVTASSVLALWLLGRWQRPAPQGGRWGQALAAALALSAALLVKQSALLVLTLPSLWALGQGLGRRERRTQVLAGLALGLVLLLPWLHHNWITTLGGTNRAVVESAAAEGDPPPLSLASLAWYPLLLPQQLGLVLLVPGLAGGLLAAWRHRQRLSGGLRRPAPALPPGWGWLIGCTLAGGLLTTLSPNKDSRYIAPVLPLLLLILARGWWQIGLALQRRWGPAAAVPGLALGLISAAGVSANGAAARIDRTAPAPLSEVMARLRQATHDQPTTLVVVPDSRDLNQHSVTSIGRRQGGQILGRQLGKHTEEHALALRRSDWFLLASGDQGTRSRRLRQLSAKVRQDGRFEAIAHWPWTRGRQVELWHRRTKAPPAEHFDPSFIAMAQGLSRGPAGLARVFEAIGPEHQLDGHFLYQERVRSWAHRELRRHPGHNQALWSLGLLATLRNRPDEAADWYGQLQRRHPEIPWPASYRAVVRLANWQPGQAREALAALPPSQARQPIPRALGDLSDLLSGRLTALPALHRNLPTAIQAVTTDLQAPASGTP